MKRVLGIIGILVVILRLEAQNVGIGTASPDYPLTIQSALFNELMSFKNSLGESKWYWSMPSGADLKLSRQTSGDNVFYIKSDGKIGIGTSMPTSMLHVNGTFQAGISVFTSLGTGGALPDMPLTIRATPDHRLFSWKNYNGNGIWSGSLTNDSNGFDLEWKAGGLMVMEMEFGTGEIGIGVSNPAQKLDVAGNINLSGSIINMSIAPLTLENGWTNYGEAFAPAGYHKDKQGIVRLTGLIRNGSSADITNELPAGYRPLHNLIFLVVSGNDDYARIDVRTDGTITLVGPYNNGYVSLDGISFKVN